MSFKSIYSLKTRITQLLPMAGQLLLMLALLIMFSFVLDIWRGRQVQGAALPGDAITTIKGGAVNLEAFSSSSLGVLYVWATWCGPCKITSPAIAELQSDYPVVTIALRSGDDATVLSEMSSPLNKAATVNDPEGQITSQLGVNVTPSVLFVKDGKVVGYTSGVSSYWGLWLRAKWLEFRLG